MAGVGSSNGICNISTGKYDGMLGAMQRDVSLLFSLSYWYVFYTCQMNERINFFVCSMCFNGECSNSSRFIASQLTSMNFLYVVRICAVKNLFMTIPHWNTCKKIFYAFFDLASVNPWTSCKNCNFTYFVFHITYYYIFSYFIPI